MIATGNHRYFDSLRGAPLSTKSSKKRFSRLPKNFTNRAAAETGPENQPEYFGAVEMQNKSLMPNSRFH